MREFAAQLPVAYALGKAIIVRGRPAHTQLHFHPLSVLLLADVRNCIIG